ncbi:hypothetical protein METBIDRAFT_180921 [Metschnikowia bicuspidata var. bicuspidata NRRL YB-4993]|uniref:Uncharacterized protein n=1 Tax=Metschnikowia bicuspidata var. bicuspidata NRRL YB-4993 TaxID=869754 RepID=A0A1A0HB41_9ASCO|nr:hypothetical protein METBIDRAFT_180921 [Metschnikowia bicuspidata var. bicuspidata NRRL YB-4993]OBA21344.1 hypothetical protein METBIDRAFT_180921 [Metschnikowia bicuspidata var. bicuspidata NRRL YB-4993]
MMTFTLENDLDEFSTRYWECCQEVITKQTRVGMLVSRLSSPLPVTESGDSASKSTSSASDSKNEAHDTGLKHLLTSVQSSPKRLRVETHGLKGETPSKSGESVSALNPLAGDTSWRPSPAGKLLPANPRPRPCKMLTSRLKSIGNPFYKQRNKDTSLSSTLR